MAHPWKSDRARHLRGATRSAPTWTASVIAAVLAIVALVVLPGAGASAQIDDDPFGGHPERLTLATVMSGETREVVARATSISDRDSMDVRLEISNGSDAPVEVDVPPGTLLASGDQSQQTIAVAGPATELVSAGGSGSGTVLAPPGDSEFVLIAFCGQEYDYGPVEPTPLTYAGTALAPLPAVLGNVMRSDPFDPFAAQEAVWWVTDDPVVPVADPGVAALLDGVDTKSFAAEPVQVVPDDAYVPAWAGGADLGFGGFDDGAGTSGPGPDDGLVIGAFWAVFLVVAAAVGGFALWQGNRRTATVSSSSAVRSAGAATSSWDAGWYPDPAGGPHLRWWDGRSWTAHVR